MFSIIIELFQIIAIIITIIFKKTCPNANGAKGSQDVTLINAERVNGIQRIRYKRKLDTGDVCDR